jgi:hypothetical protein
MNDMTIGILMMCGISGWVVGRGLSRKLGVA